MTTKISFTRSQSGDYHYQELRKLVTNCLASAPERPQIISRIKALACISLYCSLYILALASTKNPVLFHSCYLLMGIVIVFIFLNVIHEALHGNLFRNKRMNYLCLCFLDVMGANSYIFKKRHSVLHHNFPNIAGWDSDIEQAYLIKINPHDEQKSIHRIQHWTFSILYPLYLVNWLFVRDFKDYFLKTQDIRKVCTKIPVKEYIKLFMSKVLFTFYTICIPVLLGVSFSHAIFAMFSMLIVAGVFALIVLLTPHVNIKNEFPCPDSNNKIVDGWLFHQFRTTNDISTSNWITRNIMANFNFHLAHHLFPHVSYVYTPQVTQIIKAYAMKHNLRYRSYTVSRALKYHYQLLRENARVTDLFEEDM